MVIPANKIDNFQKKILAWYAENKRDLPWRNMPAGISLQGVAYRILVSEVMSQQTQVSRVVSKYEAWLKKLPTIQDLAASSAHDVLLLWSGLGYNRRALSLQKAAKCIVDTYQGTFPETSEELKTLPGIGEYTARAILCFAFNKQVAVVDTNVKRVILTQFSISNLELPMSNREFQEIADQLLPKGKAKDWNQALMDYSAIMLKKEKIPLIKQSKFIGSDRYYRGKIIKLLLKERAIPIGQFGLRLRDDFSERDEAWFKKIIDKMIKEEILVNETGFIILKS